MKWPRLRATWGRRRQGGVTLHLLVRGFLTDLLTSPARPSQSIREAARHDSPFGGHSRADAILLTQLQAGTRPPTPSPVLGMLPAWGHPGLIPSALWTPVQGIVQTGMAYTWYTARALGRAGCWYECPESAGCWARPDGSADYLSECRASAQVRIDRQVVHLRHLRPARGSEIC